MIDFNLSVAPDISEKCDERHLTQAVSAVCDDAGIDYADQVVSIDIRLVGEHESAVLNDRYRGKSGATNVLSFPADARLPGFRALGDLVICIPVVIEEAAAQGKTVAAHLTHMVVHGSFHLLGFDHIGDDEAEIMETAERRVMARLDYPDPYAEMMKQNQETTGGTNRANHE